MLYIVTHRVKGLNEDVLFHAIFEKNIFMPSLFFGIVCKFINGIRTHNVPTNFIIKFGYNARCHWLKERAL